jgi:UDP-N-acetylglucosamine diphosphorylase / glucose-1-phosphate thymidylyltransferase / UDP-N-acetylgalactosamine diphosphorylase / glucosamine-1-phosphate N-acetyltransferase / galactosamine-1-phosphate N-acetyltransferase
MKLPIVIAAAGRGTRMKELALAKPKHLIEVAAKPFLYYLLRHIYDVGLTRVIIVTGHLSAEFDKFVADYKAEFSGLEIINQYDVVGQTRYGSLMPLLSVRHVVSGAPFLMVNGDHLYSVRDLSNFCQVNQNYNYIAATQVDDPAKFGTLVIDKDNFLTRIDEKVPKPVTNLINAGLYRFTPEIFEVADSVGASPRGEYEITDAITALAKNTKVKIIQLKDYWLDFGRPDDIKLAEGIIAHNY